MYTFIIISLLIDLLKYNVFIRSFLNDKSYK